MIKTGPGFSNSRSVRQHAYSTLHLGEIASWYYSWWLVVDSDLETSWTPVDKLNRSLSLNSSNGSVDILRNNIAYKFSESEIRTSFQCLKILYLNKSYITHYVIIPLYKRQQAMYFPCLGSHLTIWLAGSKQALVISATDNCSWYAFSEEITGAYVTRGK